MSRSGYSYDCDYPDFMWRGAVASATRGKRGQALLRAMLAAFDAMENKRLIRNELIKDGEVCALGAVGAARKIDMTDIDPEDREVVAKTFDIAGALAAEIMYMNDDRNYRVETPEQRFTRMRQWVKEQIKNEEIIP